VFVEAPARLHFGVLDLRGELGRRFGGIGAAVPAPSLLLEARPAPALAAEGPDAARALEFARRFAAHHGIELRVHFCLHRAIPAHAGLGSGTQLALAVARASAELYELETDAAALARAVGRGARSAVGTWTFAYGGFVLEGGRRTDAGGAGEVAPLLARLPVPEAWRYVLAVPPGRPGLAGEEEAAAFARLPAPPAREVERVAHLVLLQLLPALAEGDLAAFGAALGEVQRVTGGWFAPAQGGVFAPGPTGALVERLREWGAHGVGQSSWGPAVYGIVDDAAAARLLAERARALVGPEGAVYEGGFSATGARVWREGSPGGPGADGGPRVSAENPGFPG
jgi:beta-RFAP synthase